MSVRPLRPSISNVGVLAGLLVLSVGTKWGPLAIESRYLDLAVGVISIFGAVVVFGWNRILVSRARRQRGFREWSGPLTSNRLMQMLLVGALVLGALHIYDAGLQIFKVLD